MRKQTKRYEDCTFKFTSPKESGTDWFLDIYTEECRCPFNQCYLTIPEAKELYKFLYKQFGPISNLGAPIIHGMKDRSKLVLAQDLAEKYIKDRK